MKTKKVWYVTGASQGFGLTLVRKLLRNGYSVAATSRATNSLEESVSDLHKDVYFLPLMVDLNDIESIRNSITHTIEKFGGIDVVVNNAGYGMAATLEETEDDKIQSIIDINIIGTINVTKAVLPHFRAQKSGYFINLSSVAGFSGAPGWSVYSATKAAVTAFSEVLALDLNDLGIKVTAVEPSGFRTNFLTKNSLAFQETKIPGYEAVRDTQIRYLAMDGKQPGDPEKAAEIFIDLANTENTPVHLFLGADAYNRASKKIDEMREELEQWKPVTLSADFK
jgi:short-subunit dehydrogenase